MQRRPHTGSIWDLDDADARVEHAYAEYEEVFVNAFLDAFGRLPSRARTAGYLQRYFRFGVVPSWLLRYVHGRCHGISIANLADAPVDPQVDLLLLAEALRTRPEPTPRAVLFA